MLLTATEMPYSLKNLHTIYFTAGPYEGALQRLTAYLANPASPPVESTPGPAMAQQVPVGALSPAAVAVVPSAAGEARLDPRTQAPATPAPAVAPAPVAVPAASPVVAAQLSGASAQSASVPAAPQRRRSFWRALFSRRR